MKKSIYQIAKEAGVSPATVSRVLNNNPSVSDITRQRVLGIMNGVNFIPAITKNAFENIGVFIGASDSDKLTLPLSPYCAEVISGLGSILYKYNYSLSLIPVHNIPKSRDDFKLFCFRRHIAAAVFLNVSLQDTFITDFVDLMPIVCIGTNFGNDKIVSIKTDNTAVSQAVVRHLFSLGHRNIALLNVDLNVQDHLERYQSISTACQELGLLLPPNHVLPTNTRTYDDLPYLLEQLIDPQAVNPVTALICFDNQFSMRILYLLSSMGHTVPQDISLVGYDDYAFAQFCLPPLTAVRQPIMALGMHAAQHLVNTLRGENTVCSESLEPQLIIRKSTAVTAE